MARWLKKLPFRELSIPLKMAKGRILNGGRRVTPFRELEIEHGSLRLIDGVPLLHLRGTHREMGRALGNLVGAQAYDTFHSYMRCFAPDFNGDLKIAREMEPQLPDWFTEEMRGFSETSELSYDEILVGQCFLDIHKVAACSTIAVHDKLSRDGEMLIGRNLDFPSLSIAHEANIVVVYEPQGSGSFSSGTGENVPDPLTGSGSSEMGSGTSASLRSLTPFRYAGVTWPGFLGVLTGLNTHGLALSMMLVYGQQRHEHLRGQPFPLVFRRLLHECASVRQADSLLQTRPFCTATNLILADASRTAARFQLHPADPITEYTTEQNPAAICTNHYHDARIKRFAFTWFSSAMRYGKLHRRVNSGEPFDVQAIKDALQATGIPPINLQRVIMRPEQLSMEVSFRNNGRGPGHWVSLNKQQLFPEHALAQAEPVELANV
ncbi:MAG: hypothetical protein H6841_07525 [Planctomycetes bacterium]|nr:hypothetical protein [Planctomycetota bacterium]MCB9935207.1 hypothetical protein [Planctomycetota bacterium]